MNKFTINANTKGNKDMLLYWFMLIYVLRFLTLDIPLLLDLIDLYYGLFELPKSFLYYFLITPPWYIIILRIVYIVPLIWLLRIKNMLLKVNEDDLIYTGLFKIKKMFKVSDIKFYHITSRYKPSGCNITVYLSNRIICYGIMIQILIN